MRDLKKDLECGFPRNLLVGSVGIGLCVSSGIVPALYGFDTEPLPRTHYFEERPQKWNDIHHNPTEEQKMLIRLDQEGLVLIKGNI